MVDTSFISSDSNSSSGTVVIDPPSSASGAVICGGYIFPRNFNLASPKDFLYACALGIANKIWSVPSDFTITHDGKNRIQVFYKTVPTASQYKTTQYVFNSAGFVYLIPIVIETSRIICVATTQVEFSSNKDTFTEGINTDQYIFAARNDYEEGYWFWKGYKAGLITSEYTNQNYINDTYEKGVWYGTSSTSSAICSTVFFKA